MKVTLVSSTLFLLWLSILTHIFLVGRKVFTNPKPDECSFCQAINSTRFKYYEDEEVVALRDESPVCAIHMLILPVEHTKDVHSITLQQLAHLNQTCHSLLDNTGSDGRRVVVFHRPPYYSVPHLHLHCKLCTPQDELGGSRSRRRLLISGPS